MVPDADLAVGRRSTGLCARRWTPGAWRGRHRRRVSSRISPVLVRSDAARPCTGPVGTKRRQTTRSSWISTDISPKSVGKCRRTQSRSAALMFCDIPSAASAASRTCGDEGSTTEWCHVLEERQHGTDPKGVGAAPRHRDEHLGFAAKLGAYGRDQLVQVGLVRCIPVIPAAHRCLRGDMAPPCRKQGNAHVIKALPATVCWRLRVARGISVVLRQSRDQPAALKWL
jgi:hypothetical protein